MWLRQRGAAWEIKVPLAQNLGLVPDALATSVDRYKELQGEHDVRRFLLDRGLLAETSSSEAALEAALLADEFSVVCQLMTERHTYLCDSLSVPFDTARPLDYHVGEVELLVSSADAVAQAEQRIWRFAADFGLDQSRLPGKVLEHIRRHSPAHWAALGRSGLSPARQERAGQTLKKGVVA